MSNLLYKIDKYQSKLKSCKNDFKKSYYLGKIRFYKNQIGAGPGETNVLIVFNSNNISGSQLEKIFAEKEGKDINENLMSKSDLEKILQNKAYIIDEKSSEASLFGSGILSGLMSKEKNIATPLNASKLNGENSKKIKSEIKIFEDTITKIKKTAEIMKSDFIKNSEEITKLNGSYESKKSEQMDNNSPAPVIECTTKIIQITKEIEELLNNRKNKMSELESVINESTSTIDEKLKLLGTTLQEIDNFSNNVTTNTKAYNDYTKEYISCITPDKKMTLPIKYAIVNYQDVAKKIKEQSEKKMNFDSYMICTLKKIGKNILLKIGKI